MSAEDQDSFGRFVEGFDYDDKGVGQVYGSWNTAQYTKVRCPNCGEIILVPWGHFDTVHDCSIRCKFSGDVMLPIPGDPTSAVVPLTPTEAWMNYFYYCPNPSCLYLLKHGSAWKSRRVMTEVFVGR